MKRTPIILLIVFTVCWMLPSCEKELTDDYPIMESFYTDSITLPTVTIDSVNLFTNKVNGYVSQNPQAKEHRRYSQIKENIKAASLRLSIIINDEWDGDTLIKF